MEIGDRAAFRHREGGNAAKKPFAVFVGRVCPVHAGHQVVLRNMIEECGGEENCLVIIGSSNSPISLRHFFSYEERCDFLLALFSRIRVVGLPDYPTDAQWMIALDDLLRLADIDPPSAFFFGGCEEDVRFFIESAEAFQSLTVLTVRVRKFQLLR